MVNIFHSITSLLSPSTVAPLVDITDILENLPGKVVAVATEAYGLQYGTVEFITPSPYYGDNRIMAYVVSLPGQPGWAEYVDVTEVL